MANSKKVTLDEYGLAEKPGSLTVYNFDPENGLFIGSSDEYISPGVGIPANSTISAPLESTAEKVSVFKDGDWILMADHRGESVYSTKTGEVIIISLPGDYPKGSTELAPTTPYDTWNGSAWVTDKEAKDKAYVEAVEQQKKELLAKAHAAISLWQTELQLGIISDVDRTILITWMKYIKAVQAVNTSTVSGITWPEIPA